MQKRIVHVHVAGESIPCVVKKSKRAKHVRLSIRSSDGCTLSVPRWYPDASIVRILEEKAHWILEQISCIRRSAPLYTPHGDRDEYIRYKRKALSFAQERLEYFNKHYGFSFARVAIRNQKTRWGSCSKKGCLNFSYKIALLPSELADYIIVHELCHRKEFNHSPRFWKLVGETMPRYQEYRRELAKRQGIGEGSK